jgi:uncharacterized protein
MVPTSRSSTLLRLGVLVAAWAALTAFSAVIHHQVWNRETPPGTTGIALQIASNLLHTMTGPAWMVLRVVTGRWGTSGYSYLLAADGIGWGLWFIGILVVLQIRARLLKRPRVAASQFAEEPSSPPSDSGRRRFIVDGALAAAGVGAAGMAIRGAAIDPWELTVPTYSVPIRDLPHSLEGLKIVQLSDTHLGPRIPASFLRSAVELALSRRPDLVLLSGDYVHNGERFIPAAAAVFGPIVKAGLPVAGVLGNHDWYNDGRAMRAAMEGVGVRMIDNARVYLDAATRKFTESASPGRSLCIGGVGDLLTHFVSVRLALDAVDPAIPRLLLAHNPDTAETIQCTGIPGSPAPRIDLMLSGHTHGGQVRLPFIGTPLIPSRYGQKYAGGLVQGPSHRVLISRGVGMSLLPVRFGVPPEVVEITLTRA